MFFDRQTKNGISKNLRHKCQSSLTKHEEKSLFRTIKDKAKKYLLSFLETSSVHGLNHFIIGGRHPFELILWLKIVILSIFGTIYLSRTTWIRYQSSPTVISMDRDMYAWNTTFPCTTICPDGKIDPMKLDSYLQNSKDEDKGKLKTFIEVLANATFENFATLPDYNGIAPKKYMETLTDLSPIFKPSLSLEAAGVGLKILPTVTEMGLCYTIGSKVAVYNSLEFCVATRYRKANRWDIVEAQNSSLFVHPLDGEVLAQLLNLSTSYNAYIHGPFEVPDISTKYHRSPVNSYMKLYVTATTVYTTPEAASLSVAQRRCRFPHENNLQHNSVYTYAMCRMECRIQLCLKYCQCVPHFYRDIGNEKVCDVEGLKCLVNYKDILLDLRFKDRKVECECLPICDDVSYVVQSSITQKWALGTNFQWGIVNYPRMRHRRDIIFGFTDVLVSVGGMAGLFLGCSVLSFMEIIYFITLRLICYTRNVE